MMVLTLPLTGNAQFDNFVTRKGDKLLDGDKQLRFISFNAPNLHYLEDYLPKEAPYSWTVEISTSADLREFGVAECKRQEFTFGKNDYGFYDAEVSLADSLRPAMRYVKVTLTGGAQIGRVEVTYGPAAL